MRFVVTSDAILHRKSWRFGFRISAVGYDERDGMFCRFCQRLRRPKWRNNVVSYETEEMPPYKFNPPDDFRSGWVNEST